MCASFRRLFVTAAMILVGGLHQVACLASDVLPDLEHYRTLRPGDGNVPEESLGFGNDFAAIGDVSGDGVRDIVVGAYITSVAGRSARGQVSLYSGADGSLIDVIDPVDLSKLFFGSSVINIGDVDSDGVEDFGAGGDGFFTTFSGLDRRVLWRFEGSEATVVGDIDGDSIDDLAIGRAARVGPTREGRAYIVSGANGAVVRLLDNPYPNGDVAQGFGSSVAGLGDIDHDDIPDVLVGAWQQVVDGQVEGQFFAFSGATGELIYDVKNPAVHHHAPVYGNFGRNAERLGDVTGDSVDDFLASELFATVSGYPRTGQAYVFSGVDGSLYRVVDPPRLARYQHFGHSIAALPDLNGDSVVEYAIRDNIEGSETNTWYFYSGSDGSLVQTMEPDIVVSRLKSLGDLNSDQAIELGFGGREDTSAGVFHIYSSVGVFPTETGLMAGDGLAARFGRTVEIQDDFAFVGDDRQPGGAVYVFEFDGRSWVQTDKLVGDSGSSMGNSLFVDDDLLVAGDPAGRSAYVFRYDGSRYRREARLRPIDPNANLIGTSVGVSGDTVVISGLQRRPSGVTYVYDFDGVRWNRSSTLTVPGASSIFGHCTIQGDTIVIGDTYNDSASVFERSGGGWHETGRLVPSDADDIPWSQNFGLPVRIDGDNIAVGAVWDTDHTGAVYVFHRDASGWQEAAKLVAQNAVPGDYLGAGVSLEGTRIIAGATQEYVDAERSGAAYVFDFDGSDWRQTLRLTRQQPGVECDGECVYGGFVALSGDRAIIGENGADRAWVYQFPVAPTRISDLVVFDPDPSTYYFTRDIRGCPSGFRGKFGFEARLANISQSRLSQLQVQVAELSGGNLALTATGGRVGEGGTIPVLEEGDYSDGHLAPGEYVDVPFTICLTRRTAFTFFVEVLGQVEGDPQIRYSSVSGK